MEETGVVVSEIKPKMQFTGKVLKTSLAGALIDIGIQQPAVLHISQISAETDTDSVRRVEDLLQIGQEVNVWVRKVKEGHIELTMVKPLELEWRDMKKGQAVKGTVVRLEKFGAFVEIGAERPGLVHISEMAHGYVKMPNDVVKEGDVIDAEILEINRKKRQIKLSMKSLQPEPVEEQQVKTEYEKASPSREKPARHGKKPRGKSHDEFGDGVSNYMETSSSPEEVEPTAMEIAIRGAMEKVKKQKQQYLKAHKIKPVSKEQEDILARTLENKVQV